MLLYTDDLVLFLVLKPKDFYCIHVILDLFASTLGLITNLDKCLMHGGGCCAHTTGVPLLALAPSLPLSRCASLSLGQLLHYDEQ